MSSISICALSILVPLGLHVGTVDAADVLGIEHRLHRTDGGKRLLHLLEQVLIENLGVGRGFIGRVFVNIPAAEDQIVQDRPGARNP